MKRISLIIKTALCLLIVCAMTLSLAACDLSKDAVSAKKFAEAAEDLDLITQDATDQYGDIDFLKSSTIAASIDDDTVLWQAEFMVLKSEDDAESSFSKNKSNFEDEGSGTEVSMNGLNYESFSKTAGGEYMYLCRVEKTLIYVKVDKEYKDDVSALIDAIGY